MEFKELNWIGIKKGEILDLSTDKFPLRILEENKNIVERQSCSVIFRKKVRIDNNFLTAKVRICGVGFYELRINGIKPYDAELTPLITEYNKRVLFDVYDVTNYVNTGENVITVEVAGGYYAPQKKYWSWRMLWLGNPRCAFSLDISDVDGKDYSFTSDDSWKAIYGDVLENCIYDGITIDARALPENLYFSDYDDSESENAVIVEPPCKSFEENKYPKIKVKEEFFPLFVNRINSLTTVYSFKNNRSGWVKIGIYGKSGDKITIRHSERLNNDNTLDVTSNRAALNTDTYILKGGKVEYFTPKFAFRGFQHVSCEKSSENVQIVFISQQTLYSDIGNTGYLCTDNKEINLLHSICVSTMKNMYLGLPLDCSQRDERLGWLGDAYVTSMTGIYNFSMMGFYEKWLDDIRYGASPEGEIPLISPRSIMESSADFSGGYLIIAYNVYKFYNNCKLIEKHYTAFKAYVEFLIRQSKDYVLPKSLYGDWSSCESNFVRGDPYYANTLQLYYLISLVYEFSVILNVEKDTEKYSAILKYLKKKLIGLYYDFNTKTFGDGSLFSTAFSLKLGLIPKEDEIIFADSLEQKVIDKNFHLYTGIFGTLYVMDMLIEHGYCDTAEKVILNPEYPGWLYMIKESTTLTERWDAVSDSLDHGMFSSVDAQMYKLYSGINIDYTSEMPIRISPFFSKKISRAEGKVELNCGEVKTMWARKNGEITLKTTVPNNVAAEFVFNGNAEMTEIIYQGKKMPPQFNLESGETIVKIRW